MKIVQVLPSLRTGGAETLGKDYAIHLKDKGIDSYVFVLDKFSETPNAKFLEEANIPIIYVGDKLSCLMNNNFILSRIIRYLKRQTIIMNEMKKIEPDIIHCHLTPFSSIIFLSYVLHNAKIFYTVHSEIKSIFKSKINTWLAHFALKNRKVQLIVLHNRVKKECDNKFNCNNTIVLNNGIDMKRFINARKNSYNIRKKLKISDDTLLVGHVGSLSKVKNHDFLLSVFKDLLIGCKAKLLLIGDGDLRNEVLSKINQMELNDKVILLKNRSDIPDLMAAMDVFVFPSLFEGFPLVLIEAQAIGLTCVISDTITNDVILTDKVVRMSLDESYHKWAETILNPKGFSKPIYKLNEFSMDFVVNRLLEIYGRDWE